MEMKEKAIITAVAMPSADLLERIHGAVECHASIDCKVGVAGVAEFIRAFSRIGAGP